jgi:hypothetical protein
VYFFLQPMNMVLKIVVVPLLKQKRPDLWYGVPMIVLVLLYLSTGSLMEAVKLYLTMYGFFGLMLGRVLFCGHRLQ